MLILMLNKNMVMTIVIKKILCQPACGYQKNKKEGEVKAIFSSFLHSLSRNPCTLNNRFPIRELGNDDFGD